MAALSTDPVHIGQQRTLDSGDPENTSMPANAPNPSCAPDTATQGVNEPPAGVRRAENAPLAVDAPTRVAEEKQQACKAEAPTAGEPVALLIADVSSKQGSISGSGCESNGNIFESNTPEAGAMPCGPISSNPANNHSIPGPGRGPIIILPSATFEQVRTYAPHQVVAWLSSQGYFIEFGTEPDVAILKARFISKHMSGSALLDFGYELEWLLHSLPAAPSSRLIVIVKNLYRAAGIFHHHFSSNTQLTAIQASSYPTRLQM